MLIADYQRAVQLLLRLVPPVFATEAFALKGGTAINLFMAPVSRLSVDLDLVFLPLGLSRDEALASISSELDGCASGRHPLAWASAHLDALPAMTHSYWCPMAKSRSRSRSTKSSVAASCRHGWWTCTQPPRTCSRPVLLPA